MTPWKYNLTALFVFVTTGLLLGACAETNGQPDLATSPDTQAPTTKAIGTTRSTQPTTTTTSHQVIWLQVKFPGLLVE